MRARNMNKKQLKRRKDDYNLKLEVRYILQPFNRLTTYLYRSDKLGKRERLYRPNQPFKRVLEIWYKDMGLN